MAKQFTTYKQRQGHDINGVRPVMIPDEAGEWVSRHDAEHVAEQLKQAHKQLATQRQYYEGVIGDGNKRIAELENDEVRQRLANAEHQLYMAELAKRNLKASRKAQFRKRLAAEKRIAELEAKLQAADTLQDGAFRHGLQHGFSYGQTNDQAGFEQCIAAYSSQRK